MRHLLEPRVLNQASLAGLVTALACYPRLALWLHRPGPVWYLDAIIFVCAIMLWGFVFAWHTPYTNRPVFMIKPELEPVVTATLTAICAGAAYHFWLDQTLRSKFPEDYPSDLQHWLAYLPFILTLNQLLLVFGPFDWLIRLVKNRWVAASLTAIFGAGVMAMKIHSLASPLPASLIMVLMTLRIVGGFLAVLFYLRGGIFLVWWWTFLLDARLLLDFSGHT